MGSLRLKDCAFTLQMESVRPASSLSDLVEGLKECSADCLYHHFCHPILHRRTKETAYHNDLAIWAADELRDRVLAERLSMINPFGLANLEELRQAALEVIQEHLDAVGKLPPELPLNAFRFIRSVTVVFPTTLELHSSADLMRALGEISDHSLYYHFVEARTANGNQQDDFSIWLASVPGVNPDLVEAVADLDFYYMTLDEIRHRLLHLLGGR